jgi:hypothetical protein
MILLTSVYVKIKREDSFAVGRPLQYLWMTQRASRIVIARAPMLLHAESRKLIILGMPLIVLRAGSGNAGTRGWISVQRTGPAQ